MNIVTAKLVSVRTKDGMIEFNELAHVGAEYQVDLDSIKEFSAFNIEEGKLHSHLFINDMTGGEVVGQLPIECLEWDGKESN